MSLEVYLASNVEMTHVLEPTFIIAFVASWCPHSINACKELSKFNIPKKIYAVDKEAFVDPTNLNSIIEENTRFKYLYNKYIENNNVYKWKYPHIFMKNNVWHYVGGEESMKLLSQPKIKF